MTRKKPAAEMGPKVIGEGLVIDEWVSIPLSELLSDQLDSFS